MDQKKLSHKEVNYRVAISIRKRCSTCGMYIERVPGDCTLVQQPIKGSGVCDRWLKGKERRQ